jgi:hypothetical protein
MRAVTFRHNSSYSDPLTRSIKLTLSGYYARDQIQMRNPAQCPVHQDQYFRVRAEYRRLQELMIQLVILNRNCLPTRNGKHISAAILRSLLSQISSMVDGISSAQISIYPRMGPFLPARPNPLLCQKHLNAVPHHTSHNQNHEDNKAGYRNDPEE